MGAHKPHQLPIGTVLKTGKGHSFLFGETKGDGGFGLTYIAKEMSSGKSGGNQGVLSPALPAPACPATCLCGPPRPWRISTAGGWAASSARPVCSGRWGYPAHRPCAGLFRSKRHRLYGDGVPPWGHPEELDGPAPRRGAPRLPVEGPSPDEKPGAAPPGRCHPPGHRPGQHHADAGTALWCCWISAVPVPWRTTNP